MSRAVPLCTWRAHGHVARNRTIAYTAEPMPSNPARAQPYDTNLSSKTECQTAHSWEVLPAYRSSPSARAAGRSWWRNSVADRRPSARELRSSVLPTAVETIVVARSGLRTTATRRPPLRSARRQSRSGAPVLGGFRRRMRFRSPAQDRQGAHDASCRAWTTEPDRLKTGPLT